MVEKIGTIKNPLTIIAIFAAISEISGTAVLPFVAEAHQGTYIWFLMLFPLFLIVFFFLTLNFNHKVLYAPSDFKDEENFFKSFKPASPLEREEKLKEQAQEVAEEIPQKQASAVEENLIHKRQPLKPEDNGSEGVTSAISNERFSAQAKYLLAEKLVLNRISKETGRPVRREVTFASENKGPRFTFDGVIYDDEKVTAIEIKYISSPLAIRKRIKDVIDRVLRAQQGLSDQTQKRFSLLLVLVTDLHSPDQKNIEDLAYSFIGITPFPVKVRIFSIAELENDVIN